MYDPTEKAIRDEITEAFASSSDGLTFGGQEILAAENWKGGGIPGLYITTVSGRCFSIGVQEVKPPSPGDRPIADMRLKAVLAHA